MIILTKQGDKVLITIDGFLDSERFAAYQQVCRACNAKYDKTVKGSFLPMNKVADIIKLLQKNGFDVEIPEELAGHVKEQRQELKKEWERIDNSKLYGFQKKGAKWLLEKGQALLADDMGLGKTAQTIMALPQDAGALIVCPASLKRNWRAEFKKWRDDYVIRIVEKKEELTLPQEAEIVIINYDILPDAKDIIPSDYKFFLIADEAHYLKNSKAKRTKAFNALSKICLDGGGGVWLLSGTPMPNNPIELWNVLKAAGLQNAAFGSWHGFTRAFNGFKNNWGGWEWGVPNREKIRPMLKPVMLRRSKIKVLDELPEKLYRTLPVEIGEETKRLCDEALHYLEEIEEVIGAGRADKILFQQLSSLRQAMAMAKIPYTLQLIETYEEANAPVIVFSDHSTAVDEIVKRDGWEPITGAVPLKKRDQFVKGFQDGHLKGLALTIGAGGTGLTLTRANQAIFNDMAWTPAQNLQAEDRIYRIGQDRGVVINRLVADHKLDRMITTILEAKQHLIQNTIQEG